MCLFNKCKNTKKSILEGMEYVTELRVKFPHFDIKLQILFIDFRRSRLFLLLILLKLTGEPYSTSMSELL